MALKEKQTGKLMTGILENDWKRTQCNFFNNDLSVYFYTDVCSIKDGSIISFSMASVTHCSPLRRIQSRHLGPQMQESSLKMFFI